MANQYVRNPMRIRNVHFKAFQNWQIDDAELATGLPLFRSLVGLWCVADHEGRFEWDTRKLRSMIFPYRSDRELDFAKVLDELIKLEIVRKYEVAGKFYGWLPTFKQYQYFSKKEAPSALPEQPWCAPGGHPESAEPAPGAADVLSDVRRSLSDVRRVMSDDNGDDQSNTTNAAPASQNVNGVETSEPLTFKDFNDILDRTLNNYPMKPNNPIVRKKWKQALEVEIESLHHGSGTTVSRWDIALVLHDRVLTYAEAKPDKVYTLENWLKNGVYQQSWVSAYTTAITPAEIDAAADAAAADTFRVQDVEDEELS